MNTLKPGDRVVVVESVLQPMGGKLGTIIARDYGGIKSPVRFDDYNDYCDEQEHTFIKFNGVYYYDWHFASNDMDDVSSIAFKVRVINKVGPDKEYEELLV